MKNKTMPAKVFYLSSEDQILFFLINHVPGSAPVLEFSAVLDSSLKLTLFRKIVQLPHSTVQHITKKERIVSVM